MYFFTGILFFICIIFFLINHFRKNRIICRISHMDFCSKICLLNELLAPFGFSYIPEQDIISTRLDAWQRSFGYHALFDRTAVHFNMVFDCFPIYFDYGGRTWLIEFWKGQYGINTGAEIGVYAADSLLAPAKRDETLFHAASDDILLQMSIRLFRKDIPQFGICRKHWWLTGFCMGQYSQPNDLTLEAALTFPNMTMRRSFVNALLQTGYPRQRMYIQNQTVSLIFFGEQSPELTSRKSSHKFAMRWAQFQNHLFLRIYCFITRHFSCTLDKLLYLYFFLPASFLHMLRFQKCKKQHFHK